MFTGDTRRNGGACGAAIILCGIGSFLAYEYYLPGSGANSPVTQQEIDVENCVQGEPVNQRAGFVSRLYHARTGAQLNSAIWAKIEHEQVSVSWVTARQTYTGQITSYALISGAYTHTVDVTRSYIQTAFISRSPTNQSDQFVYGYYDAYQDGKTFYNNWHAASHTADAALSPSDRNLLAGIRSCVQRYAAPGS